VSSKKLMAGVAVVSVLSVAGFGQAAQGQAAQGQGQTPPGQAPAAGQTPQAQAPAAGQPQKQVKDQGEYDLFNQVVKETDANKKLALLNTWKEKYPQTDFKKERQLYYLDTYKNLGQPEKMIGTAKEILAEDPKDFTSMYWISSIVPTLPTAATNTEYLDLAEKSARGMLDNMDATFAADKRPATTPADAWKAARTDMEAIAYKASGWTAMVKKNASGAEENFTKALQVKPASGEVSYWLGLTIVGQKDPTTYPKGLYHIARAAAYDGPGALAPAGRTQVNDYLTKAYKGFHGDESGLVELKAQAKASALPPAGFKILSVKEIAEAKLKQEEEAAKADPIGALWKNLHNELSGPNGQQYFDSGLKEAAVPRLRGTVVSHTSKSIVLALSDKTTPEVTLELDTPIAGKAEPGTVIEFEGVGKSFTKEPFMLTMDAERSKIYNWPAPAPSKRPARRPGRTKR
jgi:hypothetical protein